MADENMWDLNLHIYLIDILSWPPWRTYFLKAQDYTVPLKGTSGYLMWK